MIPVAVVDQMKKNGCPTSAAVDPPVAFGVLPPPSPSPSKVHTLLFMPLALRSTSYTEQIKPLTLPSCRLLTFHRCFLWQNCHHQHDSSFVSMTPRIA